MCRLLIVVLLTTLSASHVLAIEDIYKDQKATIAILLHELIVAQVQLKQYRTSIQPSYDKLNQELKDKSATVAEGNAVVKRLPALTEDEKKKALTKFADALKTLNFQDLDGFLSMKDTSAQQATKTIQDKFIEPLNTRINYLKSNIDGYDKEIKRLQDLVDQKQTALDVEEGVLTSQKEKDAGEKFAGIKWGVGLSTTIDQEGRHRIKDAEVVNGIVRVKEESGTLARVMLETHLFLSEGVSRHGPFAGAIVDSDAQLQGFGLGWMWGLKHYDGSTAQSFNFGIGAIFENSVRVLGDGLQPDQPLPPNDSLRFKNVSRTGLLLMVSFSP